MFLPSQRCLPCEQTAESNAQSLTTIGEDSEEGMGDQASSSGPAVNQNPPFLPCDNVKISFLPICAVTDLAAKQ